MHTRWRFPGGSQEEVDFRGQNLLNSGWLDPEWQAWNLVPAEDMTESGSDIFR